jgi:hypothetical protein
MGIAKVNVIDGALYGFKGDIKDDLREGRVPNWMHPDTMRAQSPSEYLAECKANAKRRNGGYAHFRVYGRQPDRGSNKRVWRPTDSKARPPERIRTKLEAYLKSEHQNVLDWMREGEFFRGLRVVVEFGPRGGIKDIRAEAEYGN